MISLALNINSPQASATTQGIEWAHSGLETFSWQQQKAVDQPGLINHDAAL
jgi:hypothetical protein